MISYIPYREGNLHYEKDNADFTDIPIKSVHKGKQDKRKTYAKASGLAEFSHSRFFAA